MRIILIICYALTLILAVTGFFLSDQSPQGALLMEMSFIPLIVFAVLAAYEVSSSYKIYMSEKVMWIIGFIFLIPISGLMYLISGRKRVKGIV